VASFLPSNLPDLPVGTHFGLRGVTKPCHEYLIPSPLLCRDQFGVLKRIAQDGDLPRVQERHPRGASARRHRDQAEYSDSEIQYLGGLRARVQRSKSADLRPAGRLTGCPASSIGRPTSVVAIPSLHRKAPGLQLPVRHHQAEDPCASGRAHQP
jgi:hypothetical protein